MKQPEKRLIALLHKLKLRSATKSLSAIQVFTGGTGGWTITLPLGVTHISVKMVGGGGGGSGGSGGSGAVLIKEFLK